MADEHEEIVERLRWELSKFNEVQDKLERERESHTHWPVLDAVAKIMQDRIGQQMIESLVNNPTGLYSEVDEIHKELIERIFWSGYHFAKANIELTECPKKHIPAQKPEMN